MLLQFPAVTSYPFHHANKFIKYQDSNYQSSPKTCNLVIGLKQDLELTIKGKKKTKQQKKEEEKVQQCFSYQQNKGAAKYFLCP